MTLSVAMLAIGVITSAVLGWGPFATSAGERTGGEVRLPATAPLLVPDSPAPDRRPDATPDRATTDRPPSVSAAAGTGGAAAPAGGATVILEGDGTAVDDVEVTPSHRKPRPGRRPAPSPTTETSLGAPDEATADAPAPAAPEEGATAGPSLPPLATAARRRLALRVNQVRVNYKADPDRPRLQMEMTIANPDTGTQRDVSLRLIPNIADLTASPPTQAVAAAGGTPAMRARVDILDPTVTSIDQLQMRVRMDVVPAVAPTPQAVDAGQGDGASNVIEMTVPLAPADGPPVDPAPPSVPSDPSTPEPSEPSDPSTPETPAEPTEPDTPAEPTEPDTPAEPADPTTAVDPSEPGTSAEPTEPESPVEPAEPTKPAEPVEPSDPETPAKPEPAEPEPSEPDAPTEPEPVGSTAPPPVAEVLLPVVDPDAEVTQPEPAKSSTTVTAPTTPVTGGEPPTTTTEVPVAVTLSTTPPVPAVAPTDAAALGPADADALPDDQVDG